MSILALMIPVCGWSNVLGLQYLIPKEKDVQYLISVVCGAAVNILLCVVLITPFGTIGAAVATTVAELAVTFAQIAYTRKALPLWSYAKEAMPFILIGVVELVIVAGVGRLLGTTLISLICEVVVGVIVFVGLAYLWLRLTHNKHFELIRR